MLCVHLANLMASALGYGELVEPDPEGAVAQAAALLNLSPGKADEIKAGLKKAMEGAVRL